MEDFAAFPGGDPGPESVQSAELLKQLPKLQPCLRGNVMSRGQQKLCHFGDIPLYNRVTGCRLQVADGASFQHHTNTVKNSEQNTSASCLVWVNVYLLQTQFAGHSQSFKQCLCSRMSSCANKLPSSYGLWHNSDKLTSAA